MMNSIQAGIGQCYATCMNWHAHETGIVRGHRQIIFVTVNGIGPLTAQPPFLNRPLNLSLDFVFSRMSHKISYQAYYVSWVGA